MSQQEQEMLFPVEAVKNQGWTKMKNQGLKSRQGSKTEYQGQDSNQGSEKREAQGLINN